MKRISPSCLWIVRDRQDINPERDMPHNIARYNEAVGGVNDDTQGYHETITQLYIAAVRHFLGTQVAGRKLVEDVNALLASPYGARDLPLKFYTPERLFSVEGRRKFIAPDLLALSQMAVIG